MWSLFFLEKQGYPVIARDPSCQPATKTEEMTSFLVVESSSFFFEWLCGIPTKMMSPSIFRCWSVVFWCTSSMFRIRYWLVIYHPVSLNQPVILWEGLLSLLTWTCFEQLQTLQRLHYANPEKRRLRGLRQSSQRFGMTLFQVRWDSRNTVLYPLLCAIAGL